MTNFLNFTNMYPVMKTLRWELKPIGKTMEFIKQQGGILEHDKQKAKDYLEIKPILDKLHNKFINESLLKAQIDWLDFYDFYTEYKKKLLNKGNLSEKDIKNLHDEFESRKKNLRKEISELYQQTAHDWKLKYIEKGKELLKDNSYKILTEAGIGKVLEEIYKDDAKKLQIIKNFNGFWTYFTGFNQNRENYYTNEGKSTEIVFRIVDQNLLTFCNNIVLKDKIQEIGLNEEENQIFDIQFYNQCLTQDGIDKYNYILGGEIDENGKKVSDGINQRINEHNQKNKIKIPQLTILYKQIGSLKEKGEIFESIENDEALENKSDEYLFLCDQKLPEIKSIVTEFFAKQEDFDKVWISKANLNWISNRFFANWSSITDKGLELKIFDKKKDSNKERQIKIPEYISFADLKLILEKVKIEDQNEIAEEKRTYLFKKNLEVNRSLETNNRNFFMKLLQNYWTNIFEQNKKTGEEQEVLLYGYFEAKNQFIQIQSKFDKHNQEHKNIVKNFADKTIEILRFLKLFRVDISKRQEEISDFNKTIDLLIQDFDITKYYDLIRNYLTKKPFNIEKMKLNFDCSTLLGGRDKNKETQNLSVILKDKNGFYLAIMKKQKNKFFEQDKNGKLYDTSGSGEIMQKMEYKQMALPTGFGGFVRKCFNSAQKYGWSCPKECLNNENKVIIKNDEVINLPKLIDCYKDFLDKYEKDGFKYKDFNFEFENSSKYNKLSDFFSEVERQGYKLSWTNINKEELMQAVEDGQLYLFQISSKDFTKKDKTTNQDLQTIYRTNMFNGQNSIKLNGEAEIFFRPASIKEKKLKDLQQKNDNAIEHKRYTEDKILFHCPITLNFGSKRITRFNDFTNEYLKNDAVNIIGIDRGEKHLNFYSVINPQGEIIEQGTLNIFESKYEDKDGNEQIKTTNYEQLLSDKAENRLQARQNRETIGKIKELKEGYISQVVRKIADLVLKYNAIIVMENLNSGFKNSRKKIEKSAYQNLELALAKKLSFLVNKNTEIGKPGSATNVFQLCPAVGNFGEIERASQRGIMFYTRANYTSTTDPISGWRKTIYLKKGNLEEMKKGILENFDGLGYDESRQAYFIKYGKRTLWSDVERRRGKQNNHGQRETKKYDPNEEFNKLFERYGITKNQNILEQIKSKSDLSAGFYSSLIWILDLIMQIRNSDDQKNDFILSCIEIDGKKFDSREYYKLTDQEKTNSVPKPTSGDANGAYNIARKGLMMVNNIKNNVMSDKNNKFYKLYISDEEWDRFSQG